MRARLFEGIGLNTGAHWRNVATVIAFILSLALLANAISTSVQTAQAQAVAAIALFLIALGLFWHTEREHKKQLKATEHLTAKGDKDFIIAFVPNEGLADQIEQLYEPKWCYCIYDAQTKPEWVERAKANQISGQKNRLFKVEDSSNPRFVLECCEERVLPALAEDGIDSYERVTVEITPGRATGSTALALFAEKSGIDIGYIRSSLGANNKPDPATAEAIRVRFTES